jgi:hypothetical protein
MKHAEQKGNKSGAIRAAILAAASVQDQKGQTHVSRSRRLCAVFAGSRYGCRPDYLGFQPTQQQRSNGRSTTADGSVSRAACASFVLAH